MPFKANVVIVFTRLLIVDAVLVVCSPQ